MITLAAASNEDRTTWLHCARGEEINWHAINRKLSTYADKYLDAPHLLREEAQLSFQHAHKPFLLDKACPLGDLTLRLFMWIFIETDKLVETVERLSSYGDGDIARDPSTPSAMLAEVLHSFWSAPLSWIDVINSGWPLFSVLAQLAQKVREGMTQKHTLPTHCRHIMTWGGRKNYLEAVEHSFKSASLIPAHASTSVLLASDRNTCPFAFASAAIALADSLRWDAPIAGDSPSASGNRNAFYYRYAAVAPLAVDSAITQDVQSFIGSEFADDQEAFARLAEDVVRFGTETSNMHLLFASLVTPWPLWRLLDRLGCTAWVQASTKPAELLRETRRLRSAMPNFHIHVFPHRVSSDGLQSSRIRALRQPYCAKEFQHELDMITLRYSHELSARDEGTQLKLRVVEAGPHLGDCLLWAAARLGCDKLHATGYDVIHQLVSMFRQSIRQNSMQNCVEAHLTFLGETRSPTSNYKGVSAAPLDEEVTQHVHLLKVHTNGGEDAILRGGRRLFSDPRLGVDVLVLNSCEVDVLDRVVDFLVSLASADILYTLELRGEPLPGPSKAKAILRATVAESGSVQLVAKRTDLRKIVVSNRTDIT